MGQDGMDKGEITGVGQEWNGWMDVKMDGYTFQMGGFMLDEWIDGLVGRCLRRIAIVSN